MILSLEDDFNKDSADIVFFGRVKTIGKRSWLVTCQLKEALGKFHQPNGVVLAILRRFPTSEPILYRRLLDVESEGLGIMGHYTLQQVRIAIGDIKIHNEKFNKETTTALKTTKDEPSSLTMRNLGQGRFM